MHCSLSIGVGVLAVAPLGLAHACWAPSWMRTKTTGWVSTPAGGACSQRWSRWRCDRRGGAAVGGPRRAGLTGGGGHGRCSSTRGVARRVGAGRRGLWWRRRVRRARCPPSRCRSPTARPRRPAAARRGARATGDRGCAGGADDLPVRVAEAHDLAVVERLVNGVGGDGLVEVLGLAAARVAPSDGLGVRGAGGDPRARRCSSAFPPTWSACQCVFTTSASCPACARTHATVSRRGRRSRCRRAPVPPVHQEQVGVRERPALPGQPCRVTTRHGKPRSSFVVVGRWRRPTCERDLYQGGGEPFSCCQ